MRRCSVEGAGSLAWPQARWQENWEDHLPALQSCTGMSRPICYNVGHQVHLRLGQIVVREASTAVKKIFQPKSPDWAVHVAEQFRSISRPVSSWGFRDGICFKVRKLIAPAQDKCARWLLARRAIRPADPRAVVDCPGVNADVNMLAERRCQVTKE